MRAQVEIILGEVNCAAIFGDEGMRVAMFAAGIVKLETRAGGQPDSGDASVVQGRSEFVKAMDGTTPLGNQRVDGDVEDTGCLAQAQLRNVEAYSSGIMRGAAPQEKKKGGQNHLPAFRFARHDQPRHFLYLVTRLCARGGHL